MCCYHIISTMKASLVAQRLKCLPAMWETWVQSLGQEDPLEKEMATHSSILAWRIPWKEEPGGLQSTGLQRVGHDWATSLSLSWSFFKKCGIVPLDFYYTLKGKWSKSRRNKSKCSAEVRSSHSNWLPINHSWPFIKGHLLESLTRLQHSHVRTVLCGIHVLAKAQWN